MPFSHSFDGPFVVARFTGTMTQADLVEMSEVINEVERTFAVAPHRMTDLRGVQDIAFQYPDVLDYAKRRQTVPLANSVRAAIVVGSPREFGFARMFQTLNDNPMIDVEVFMNEEAARAWIAASPLVDPRTLP